MDSKEHYGLRDELSAAIKPVIDKYIKLTEDKIKELTNDHN